MELFFLCELDKNKILYETKKYSVEQILEKIFDSSVLVFDNGYDTMDNFVSHKRYCRYFKDEPLNMNKTSYIIWKRTEYNMDQKENILIATELLTNLPSTIKYIKFANSFNHSLDGLEEKNITHIIFGTEFNCPVDNLPWTIEYLHFGNNFNHPLENLSGCMKKIVFSASGKFNHPLDNLPNSIEYLFLPMNYSRQLDNLPNSMLNLELNYKYPHTLNNLPKSLNKFIFYYTEQKLNSKINWLNTNLTNSSLNTKSANFIVPIIPCYYNDKIANSNSNSKPEINWIEKVFVSLPPNLKYLDLTYSYKLNLLSDYVNWSAQNSNQHVQKEILKNSQILDNLPAGLEVLKYPANYNLILVEKIPQNIIKLFMSNKFNKSVDKLLNPNFGTSKPAPPTKLTHLVFGDEFNHSVNFLPSTITHLFFGSNFNKSVDKLPNSLIFISFGTKFNTVINNFPHKLEEIELGPCFNQPLTNIKSNLKKIKFARYGHPGIHYLHDGETDALKYYYNKKITNLPIETKICLVNYNSANKFLKNDDYYSIFSKVKNNIEYY